jgi:ABC-type transporter Mla maintaining outer membrane lipid asymmetry ATPase subunit MlaF
MRDRLDCEAVVYSRGPAQLLRGVDMTIRKGEAVVVSGRSGCGKSALLELCAGLVRPAAGRVLWDGADVAGLSKEETLLARQSLGYMFQVHALISNFTVIDNLALPLRTRGTMDAAAIMKRVRREMEILRLPTAIDYSFPEALSAYESRAVAFCRALIGDPELLILDEPVAGLDDDAEALFCSIIEQRWKERPMALLMVANDFSNLPRLPMRRYTLENGRLASVA